MCSDCVDTYNGFDEGLVTPEVEALTVQIRDFYTMEGCGTGGPVHIVTDDFNIEDDNLDWCRDNAMDQTYYTPEAIAAAGAIIEAMRPLTYGQRARACYDA